MSEGLAGPPISGDDSPRFAVGIDLGTTHSVLAYSCLPASDVHDLEQPRQQVLAIAQLSKPGSIEEKSQLPSFLYQAHESELNDADIELPWNQHPDHIVGSMARDLGTKTPIRLVASAKSWLCHNELDPRSNILPFNSPDEVAKVSAFEASRIYLTHLAQAWNQNFPNAPLAEQDVTITIPASFDPAARDTTADAARQAGIKQLTLLEEPQAALYSWVSANAEQWRDQVKVGDIILVVDIGGGTTDLSLIAVTEEAGNLGLNRIAVGDHILLGGDNMDLTLAYRLKAKLAQEGKKLQTWQVLAIAHRCREAKETLLLDETLSSVQISVPSRGSKLLGATIRIELTREEVNQTLIEGFFPNVSITEHPVEVARSALSELGLPFAQDAGISRHLAAFLSKQRDAAGQFFASEHGEFIKPTAILFNGGVLKAPVLADRLLNIINQWLKNAGESPAKLLDGADLDLAVARGAAYYGFMRKAGGVRIRGGIASAYYVGIESSMPAIPGIPPPIHALCVAPFGMEEGSSVAVPGRSFNLRVGETVKFNFYGSTQRRDDEAGQLLEDWDTDEISELPEVQAYLPPAGMKAGDMVQVALQASVSDVGTLCLEAIPKDESVKARGESWRVEFDVRA